MLLYEPYGRRTARHSEADPGADDPFGDHPADHSLLLFGIHFALFVLHPRPAHTGADRRDRDTHANIHTRSADADAGGNADSVVAADLHPDLHPDPDAHSNANRYTDGHPNDDANEHADSNADGHADRYSYTNANRHSYSHTDADRDADGDTDRHTDGDTGISYASAAHRFTGAYRRCLADGQPNMDTRSHLNTCRARAGAACLLRVLTRLPLETAELPPVVT